MPATIVSHKMCEISLRNMEHLFSIPNTLRCLFINMVKNRNFPTTVAKKRP